MSEKWSSHLRSLHIKDIITFKDFLKECLQDNIKATKRKKKFKSTSFQKIVFIYLLYKGSVLKHRVYFRVVEL